VMIGRAAQGRPWIFREVVNFLETGRPLPGPGYAEIHAIASQHLQELHQFYGAVKGVRVARKHIGWYLAGLPGGSYFRHVMNGIEGPDAQLAALDRFFAGLMDGEEAAGRRAA